MADILHAVVPWKQGGRYTLDEAVKVYKRESAADAFAKKHGGNLVVRSFDAATGDQTFGRKNPTVERLEISDPGAGGFWGAKKREVHGYQKGREWFYEDGTPIEVGGVTVTAIKGYRDNPWISEADADNLIEWLRKYDEYFRRWFTDADRKLVTDFAHGIAERAATDRREGGKHYSFSGEDVSSATIRKVLAAMRRGKKEAERRIRSYGYIPRDKGALAALDEQIGELAFSIKKQNPGSDEEGTIRFEYGAIENTNTHKGGWVPMVWEQGNMRLDDYHHRGYDKDEAVRLAKLEMDDMAAHFVGDWYIIKELRENPSGDDLLEFEKTAMGWFVSTGRSGLRIPGLPSGPFASKEDARIVGEARVEGVKGSVDDILKAASGDGSFSLHHRFTDKKHKAIPYKNPYGSFARGGSPLTKKGERMKQDIEETGQYGERTPEVAARTVYAAAKRGTPGLVKKDWAREHGYPTGNPGGDHPVVARIYAGYRLITDEGEELTVVGSNKLRGRYYYFLRDKDGVKTSLDREDLLRLQKIGVIKVIDAARNPSEIHYNKEQRATVADTTAFLRDTMGIDASEARKLAAEMKAIEDRKRMGGNPAALLRSVDRASDSHGVEGLWEGDGELSTSPRFGEIPLAEYVNTGDTYNPTVLYDYSEGKFYLTTWGDWVEKYEREHA